MIERLASTRESWRLLALAVAAGALVLLNHEFAREAGPVAAIWPVNALLLATAISWRTMDWRKIVAVGAAASFVIDIAMGDTIVRATTLMLANVIEIVICVYVLQIHRRRFNITVARDLVRFIGVAGLLAPAASSVVVAFGLIGEAPFRDSYLLSFVADALGLLIFTPAMLAMASEGPSIWRNERRLELVVSLAGLTFGSVLVFSQSDYPILFVIPPLLTLATFRLGITGAGAGLLIVTFCAIAFAIAGSGPTQLIDASHTERVIVLQAFLALMSITTLPIAAALAQGQRSTEQLKFARDQAELDRASALINEAKYRTLADHATDIVVRFGPNGVITYASPSIAVLGLTPEQAIGRSVSDFAAPENRANAQKTIEHLFSGPDPDRTVRRHFRVGRPDGSFMWLEGNPSLIRDEHGLPSEVVSAYRDITAQRALEDALEAALNDARLAAKAAQASEERYRGLAEMSRDMVSRTGLDTVIRFVSPGAEAVMGYTPEELIGTSTLSHMHADEVDGVRTFFQALIAEGPTAQPRAYTFRAKRKDGRQIWLEGIPRILFDASGKPIEIQDTVRDVTARTEMEHALAEAKRAAEVAAQAKADFLANMSHELRTPLNSVVGYTHLLNQSPTIEGEDRRYVGLVSRSSRALLNIVNDVLDLSSIDAGGLRLDNQSFSVAALLEQVIGEFTPIAEAKGLSLTNLVSGASLETLSGDEGRIRQVLTNLIGNAIKFTTTGEVSVTTEALPVRGGQQRLRCSVHDTGIGVSAAQIASLFARFTQADTSVSRHFGGTGLGLAISKNLIEMMGGKIGARPRSGGGSTFWFELALAVAAKPQPGATTDVHLQRTGADSGRRILIVDDLEENRELLRLMLKGHIIDQAPSGADALELIAAHAYDLVLMDVQMPGMDGKTATQLIRQDPKYATLPVIAVSAHALPDRVASFMAAGMDDHLAKPIEPGALEAIILKWTGQAHVVAPHPPQQVMAALREKFVARCEQDLAALTNLSARDDAREIRAIVHRLAGSAATFGFADAGRVALTVDQAYSIGRPPSDAEIEAVKAALAAIRMEAA